MVLSGRLAYKITHYLWMGVDWLFPPHCAGCNLPNTRWCVDCYRKCKKINPPYCPVCGQPGDFNLTCDVCLKYPPDFSGLRSGTVYEGEIRNAIHRLKYNNDIALGEVFSNYLVRLIKKQNWQVDMVIPVPLSRERTKQRGYNQSALLARPVAVQLDLVYQNRILTRERGTRSQVGLSANERRSNVWGAFKVGEDLRNKNILLVDDVTTTGSTMNACAYALKHAGAQNVYCIALARSG